MADSGETRDAPFDTRAEADRYVAFWTGLTLETMDHVSEVFAPDGRFEDPFVVAQGAAAIRAHLDKSYRKIDDVRIEVRDIAVSGSTAYLLWTYGFRMRGKPKLWSITGMSEIRFVATGPHRGRVAAHIDHWDSASQVFAKVPGLGLLMRRLVAAR